MWPLGRLRGWRACRVRREVADASLDLVADRADLLDGLAGGAVECPGLRSVCRGTFYPGNCSQALSGEPLVEQRGGISGWECGNPLVVADLHEGETVLDLGCGIDVLLRARRVGSNGTAYGLDLTDEMLELARANAAKANARNVEFLKGERSRTSHAAETVDVLISNCVITCPPKSPPSSPSHSGYSGPAVGLE
jgi:SAM-dependent methyltransferase